MDIVDINNAIEAAAFPKDVVLWIWEKKYNAWWGNEYFSKKFKPSLFKIFGGSSYLFFREVEKGEIFQHSKDTYITITMSMPENIHIDNIDKICFLSRLTK